MADLSLSTVDERGEPVDTVLWLRNGGGKTAILGLFFAHLLPDARDFLKGRKDNAKFTDHVLDGDTSYILARWVGESPVLNLLEDVRPRLVTGRVVERRAGFSGSSLPGFMFTFRPVPGVLDIDSLPWQLGGHRLSLSAFEAEMHRLGHEHPEIEFTLTDRQSHWAARLHDVGLDPQVFRYQRQMNAGEAEAATGFMQFRTSDEFVDFLLAVVTPAEQLESLEEQIRQYADKLRRLPEWRTEQEMIERALPLLARHAGHLDLMEGLERERTRTEEAARALGRAIGAGVREAEEVAGRAQEEFARLEVEGQRVRRKLQDIEARTREVEFRQARFAEAAAEADVEAKQDLLAGAQRDLEAWRLAEPLAQHRLLLARRDQLTRLLEVNRRDAAPMLRALEQAGAALRAGRLALAATAQRAAEESEHGAEELRLAAEACEGEATRLRGQATDLRRGIEDARGALSNLDRIRRDLAMEDGLLPGERAEEAAARWEQVQETSRSRLSEIEADLRRLADEAAKLQERKELWSAQIAAKGREIGELGRRREEIERSRRTIWDHAALRAVVDVAEPDLWQEGPAVDRALRLRWLEITGEQIATGIRTAEDRRTCSGVEARGTLPPSLDTEQALAILQDAGIGSAYLGWEYLRGLQDTVAAGQILRRAPELAGGILLNDVSQLAAAREALNRAGFQPVTVMAVGLAEGFANGEERSDAVLVPPKAGLYDPGAAQDERARAEIRLRQADARRTDLQNAAESVGEARDLLAAFLRAYPSGELGHVAGAIAAREAEVADLEGRRASAEARQRRIHEEQEGLHATRDGLNRLLGGIPGLLVRLRDLAAREQGESAWLDLVAQGPARAAELAAGAERAMAQRGRHVLERDRLLRLAQRRRDEAQDFHRAAAGLPEVDFPEELRTLPLEELAERHSNLRAAYEQRLGSDVIDSDLSRLGTDLRKLEPAIRSAPDEVRRRAEELLASPDGQSDELRSLALTAAQHRNNEAVAGAALAGQTLVARQRARVDAEPLRDQAPRDDMAVPSPEAAAELLRRLGEEDRAASSEENSINAQHGVVSPRLTAARSRMVRLRSTLNLVAMVLDEGAGALAADGAPFDGSEDDADGSAAEVATTLKRLGRELDAARSQVAESRGEIRRLAEHEPYRQKMPVITLRLGEPGASAETVAAFAGEMEQRLPGLRKDIDTAETDRRMVLIGLTQAARDGFRDLHRLQEASRLPQGLDAWSGVPFVQIGMDQPRSHDEWDARVGGVLQTWVDREEIPAHSGLAILRQAVRAANGRGASPDSTDEGTVHSSFRVTLLKPDAVLTTQRYSVERMKFSEGQDLTTAILLYCTFINLRVQRSGDPAGVGGALILDNPIGKASLETLITLQRRVARVMKVQIIATTGVKDREAISHYPRIVGLRPVRSRDARRKYLRESDDPMGLGSLPAAGVGSLQAAVVVVKQAT